MKKQAFHRRAKCIHCDFEGILEIQGVTGNVPAFRIFRHRGHNPFSGRMLYQCPRCDEMLLADPMDVLSKGFIPDARSKLRNVTLLQKMFPASHHSVLLRVAAILLILWLLGMVTGFTMYSFIHVLLVLALIIMIHRLDESEKEFPLEQVQAEE